MRPSLADRLTGVFFLVFGGLLIWVLIPWQIESVDYGWLRPRTLPYGLAVVLALCGLWLMLRPDTSGNSDRIPWARAALFGGILCVGLFLISRFGFEWIAPLIAFAIMWSSGERRPFWLFLGVVMVPLVIWLLVVGVLGRPLP